MKRLAAFLGVLCCLTPYINLSAQPIFPPERDLGHSSSSSYERNRAVGDFQIIAFAEHDSVVLSNNLIYKPKNAYFVRVTESWMLQDTVRVLSTHRNGHYILIDLSTGGTIKAKTISFN